MPLELRHQLTARARGLVVESWQGESSREAPSGAYASQCYSVQQPEKIIVKLGIVFVGLSFVSFVQPQLQQATRALCCTIWTHLPRCQHGFKALGRHGRRLFKQVHQDQREPRMFSLVLVPPILVPSIMVPMVAFEIVITVHSTETLVHNLA